MIKSIGLPAMYSGKGEKRAFLPSFAEALSKYDVDIFIDENYGQMMGYNVEDYIRENPRVKVAPHDEIYGKDLVIVLKAPSEEELDYMAEGAALLSMLHYESRPVLLEKIVDNGIHSFSMDAVANDQLQRMVVTYEQTAWGGVSTAVNEMEKRRKDFYSAVRAPYNVTIFGMGNLGVNAGRLCFKAFDHKFKEKGILGVVNGITVNYIGKSSMKSKNELRHVLANTDLLIDATKRAVFSDYVLTNDLIGCLKDETIILDLTADPYDVLSTPMQVKAFEGIPYGTLENYVLETDAAEYDLIPSSVSTDFRRVTVSCNAWPGVFPEASMKIYGTQLLPFIDILILKNLLVSKKSKDANERAIYRATVDYFMAQQDHQE